MIGLALLGATLGGASCESATNTPAFMIDSVDVASDGVVGTLDAGRTYEYRLGRGRPDSVLAALWLDAIDVDAAWWPLDYICLDPVGPRLTVALTVADARITTHDFELGTGRLSCATTLREYRIIEP
jgi:hypothetical protein